MFTATAGQMQGIAEALASLERDQREKIRQLLVAIGELTVSYLRSFTAKTRPPLRGKNAPRPAHPGEWADVSGQLAASYGYTVEATSGGWALALTNSAEYAAALEARDGFWVLSGVTDRGGPVETALRRALATVAPDWTVVSYD